MRRRRTVVRRLAGCCALLAGFATLLACGDDPPPQSSLVAEGGSGGASGGATGGVAGGATGGVAGSPWAGTGGYGAGINVGAFPGSAGKPGLGDAASVALTSSCGADFSGELTVRSLGDSLELASTNATETHKLQLKLAKAAEGELTLSTQQRVDTDLVLNLTLGTSWTNRHPDGVTPTDPVSGTLTVTGFDAALGTMKLKFQAVVLYNATEQSTCQLDGTLETNYLSP